MKQLSHAEGIRTALQAVQSGLEEGEEPVLQKVRSFVSQLEVFSPIIPDFRS